MPSPQAKSSFSHVLCSALQVLPSTLHWIFLLFAIPQVIFLALWTPPFQTADEPAHFNRAWQIAHFEIGPQRGAMADSGALNAEICIAGIGFHQKARYTKADQMCAESAQWTGQLTYREFPNTGAGALTGYIPQALGIAIGKAVGLGPLRTLQLVRLLNGAFAIAVCSFALWWCRSGRLVMFAVLLMPMSLSLFASCGQDPTSIALTCLAFALISRQLDAGGALPRTQAAIVVVSLVVVSVSRPTYVALLLPLLIPQLFDGRRNRPSWITGFWFACLSLAITVAWWLTAMRAVRAVAAPIAGIGVVDAKLQLANLLHHPAIARDLLAYTIHHIPEYIAGVIGYLGWLDTLMPSVYYLIMFGVLVLAFLAETSVAPRLPKNVTAIFLCAGFAGIALVFLVEYLIWTPVGAPGIYGVQGRYFIPLLIAVAVGLPRLGNSEKTYQRVTAMVVAVQLITAVVLPQVILARYYTG